jgi:hypothetical protein
MDSNVKTQLIYRLGAYLRDGLEFLSLSVLVIFVIGFLSFPFVMLAYAFIINFEEIIGSPYLYYFVGGVALLAAVAIAIGWKIEQEEIAKSRT